VVVNARAGRALGSQALIVLQARTGSRRLPGKVLATVAGSAVLNRCVRRLQAAGAGPVMVATTALAADDVVAAAASQLGCLVARGATEDVLARYVAATATWRGRFVIRATADNPLVDIEACGRVLKHLEAGADYVSEEGLPVGAAVEGMTVAALHAAGRTATAPYDREHVTPWLRREVGMFIVQHPQAPAPLVRSDLRFTIDTADDLAYVRAVVDRAGPDPLLPLAEYIAAADRPVTSRVSS
jgi:spore coat polysaccharide biosynthesis protein SpsF (cytidylyltransferase family)